MGVGSGVLVSVLVSSGTVVAVRVGLVVSGSVNEGASVFFIAGVSVGKDVALSMLPQPEYRLRAKTRLNNKKCVFIFPDWLIFHSLAQDLHSASSSSFGDLLNTV